MLPANIEGSKYYFPITFGLDLMFNKIIKVISLTFNILLDTIRAVPNR